MNNLEKKYNFKLNPNDYLTIFENIYLDMNINNGEKYNIDYGIKIDKRIYDLLILEKKLSKDDAVKTCESIFYKCNNLTKNLFEDVLFKTDENKPFYAKNEELNDFYDKTIIDGFIYSVENNISTINEVLFLHLYQKYSKNNFNIKNVSTNFDANCIVENYSKNSNILITDRFLYSAMLERCINGEINFGTGNAIDTFASEKRVKYEEGELINNLNAACDKQSHTKFLKLKNKVYCLK